jgi:hypothetical protein
MYCKYSRLIILVTTDDCYFIVLTVYRIFSIRKKNVEEYGKTPFNFDIHVTAHR